MVSGRAARIALAAFALALAGPGWAQRATQETDCEALPRFEYERAEVVIETPRGRHRFDVDLASTAGHRAVGLMCRKHLAPERGMLFIYGDERPISMWMKNTFLSLDMLFVRADGVIDQIVERSVPLSLVIIPSHAPALAVLELPGGTAFRLDIRPGDRVRHAAFAAP